MQDTPRIASSAYATTTIPINQMMGMGLGGMGNAQSAMGGLVGNNLMAQKMFLQEQPAQTSNGKKEINKMTRRIVQVFIADTDENIPLDKSILFTGEQKLTDSTDQELFFEIDMKGILEKHNAYRITVVNKKVKERTELLEPVKIRDLKMVVVNVATF